MALNRIVFQVVLIAGPALAGVVAAGSGLNGCYLIDTVDASPGRSTASPGSRPCPLPRPEIPRRSGLALTLEGLAFIRRTPALAARSSRT